MITRFGLGALITGTAIVAVGRLFGVIELFAIGAGLVALVGLAWVSVMVHRPRIELGRRIEPDRVFVDEVARVEVTATNGAWLTTPVVRIFDPVGATEGATFNVAPLGRGADAHASYRLPTDHRGSFAVGPMRIERRDVFNLARRRWRGPRTEHYYVYPRLVPLDLAQAWEGPGLLGDALRRRPALGDGQEFRALRAYTPGDDHRRVDWKRTARTGDLVIRENEPDAVRRLAVVADLAGRDHDEASFEMVLTTTASLAVAAAADGYELLVVLAGTHRQTHSELGPLLDALALAVPSEHDGLADGLDELARHRLDGLVVVVTTKVAGLGPRDSTPEAAATIVANCATPTSPGSPAPEITLDASTPTALARSWQNLVAGRVDAVAPGRS